MDLSSKNALSNFVNASEYVKIYFRGKHGDSHDNDSQQGRLTTLMRLRDVENTVFDFTSDARLSKCKQQKRRTAKTLRIPFYGTCPLETKDAYFSQLWNKILYECAMCFPKFCGYPPYCLVLLVESLRN